MTDTGTTVLGFYPSGRGIVDIKNASSSMVLQALVLGYQGNGRLDISDTAKVSNGGYVVLGQSNGSIGIANVSDSGRWEAGAQEFYVGYDGNGTLNINSAGQVIVGNAYAGVSGTGVGIVNINGNGTKFQSAVLTVGHSGTGTLNLVNQGELELTGQSMTIAANSGSTGTVNIGAPAGMDAVAPGTIHNLGVINFGNGNGNLVFNHTNNTSAGYNVDSVILGGYADTAIIHDAGHTIFTGNNIYDGYTNINGGILTIASHSENGDDSLGISKVIISQNGKLQIEAANSENDSFRFKNMLSGSGILNVNLSSTNKIYTFMDSTGNAFTGITEMDRSTFILEKANTVTLTHAMLQSNAGNIIHVGAGEKNIGGLAFNGGTLIFDTPVPAYLDFNGGYLTLSEGGISNGMLTGEGNFHVTGNILDIIGANGNLSVTHIIDSGAEISLNNGTGAGRGNIVNEGILRLKGVKNTLSNSLRGRGEVYATAGTDVHLRGDNSNFSGLFNIEDGSAITISEQKQLGTAGVIDHGMLIVMTGQNWQLKNEIIGNGDLEKTGDATLTLTNASAGYSGTTQITAGELTLGATLDSIVKMTSTQINIHNGAVMSGFVATAKNVDVMQGGELHVSRTTIGGDLVNSGTVRMNRTGASPGNQLIVNGNYTGNNNGLIAFNTTLNGDESPTDKVIVTGDTRGSTRVVVNNIDGQGAQTDKGIELIEVNGDSAGSFALTSWVLYNWFNNTVESDHRQGDSYRSRGFTASLEAGYTFLIGELHGRAAVATGDFNWLTIQRGIQYSGNIGSGLCGSVSLHVFS